MKASGPPCPLDQVSVICLKRCPYLRTYLTAIDVEIWKSGHIPVAWKKAISILIHKKGDSDKPENFCPITLEPVLLKVFTSLLRDRIYGFLQENYYIECQIQKGFIQRLSGTLEHTYNLSYLIDQARIKQRSLTVTLLDLKNAFGEVDHMLITTTLGYHHIPDFASDIILNIYNDFYMTILTKSYVTDFIRVEKGVLQEDSLSPLLFKINKFIQHIKKEEYTQ